MKKVLFTLTVLLLAPFVVKAQADRITGVWFTEEGTSTVEIVKHTNGKYIGAINWLEEPLDENGKPKVDSENPDPKKKDDPIIGLRILKSFEYDASNKRWENGSIYDPDK